MSFVADYLDAVIPAKAATRDETCAADKVGPCFRRDDTSVVDPTQRTPQPTKTEETIHA